jgi:hypothetical protein
MNLSSPFPSPFGRPVRPETRMAVNAPGPTGWPDSAACDAVSSASSCRAASTSAPSRNRPNSQSHEAPVRLDRGRNSGCIISGTHASARRPV